MKKLLYLFIIFAVIISCKNDQTKIAVQENSIQKNETDVFYHYSIWEAFVNKIYDGTLTAGELKQKGTIGLGSYNGLDGELIMLD
ncbi:hypothetical protein BTO16_11935 [Polaribacter glomeratus]|uniref:Alpha-acetolactate decarboxylase n=1 Tax=Polaribacter glomeratus TaxID=102 RepID=A0A2S7WG73_9FLAO|nr:hypothetical protein BTO16_11935 [Polaribacter glomeratus]TXD67565.1 acetolactate decarboxylase [Polaribacter glomeratus]